MFDRDQLDHEFQLPAVKRKAGLVIRNSFNLKTTKDRLLTVVLVGLGFLAMVIYFGLIEKDLKAVSVVSIVYITISLIEKIGYGFGVLAYKKVIQKILTDDDYRDHYIEDLSLQSET